MASYIGKVEITGVGAALIGSTLYGICGTPANTAIKDITANTNGSNNVITGDYVNTSYDNLVRGTTIHVKFIYGNTVDSGAKLLVGTVTTSQDVVGNFTCPPNTIISFTLDENQNWVVNDNVDTNTEYEFMTAYNASSNKVATAADLTALNIQQAAHQNTVSTLQDGDGTTANTNLPTATAVVSYVLDKTAGLTGLTGAMHFKGSVNSDPVTTPPVGTYGNGDVVLGPNHKEYVYNEGTWYELGDEGSYVWKTSQTTDVIDEVTGWNAGTLPSFTPVAMTASNVTVTQGTAPDLTRTPISVPNVTQAGTATGASVSGGILTITPGTNTTLGTNITFDAVGNFSQGTTPPVVTTTAVNFDAVTNWNAGTSPTLTQTPTTVVVPVQSGG